MKCLRCKKNKAIKDSQLGYLPCQPCLDEEEGYTKPRLGFEFTTDKIKDERREYGRDILQPWHGGVLSKEYVQEYGTSGIEATKEQVKNARYTNKDIKGWWSRHKGKGGGKGRKSDKVTNEKI